MITSKISVYNSHSSLDCKINTVQDYINMVKYGTNQDAVISGREAKQKGDLEHYKKIKSNSICVSPTGFYESGKSKTKENINLNGLICMDFDVDIDAEKRHTLTNDKYTFLQHLSFGGDGICIWVKIDPTKINDAYDSLSKYYYDNYNVLADPSCKNSNRLRYLSFDPDIYVNEKSYKFNVKIEKKDKLPSNIDFVYSQSDFDFILEQIRDRRIDLCDEDYFKYVRIGLSLASQFGEAGRQHFHFICSQGSKYNFKHAERDYNGFVKNRNGDKTTIATFYYYCKDKGIQVYSEKTKTIINRVKVSKTQGTPNVDSIVNNLKDANNIIATEQDKQLIQQLIDSNKDFSKEANAELTEIEILINFINDTYSPTRDELTQLVYINGNTLLDDSEVDSIYIDCKKNLDFNIKKNDIESIFNSNKIKKTNILKDIFDRNKDNNPIGVIDSYADCIHPRSEYNKWAFKRWLVGAVHNWTSDINDNIVSPLTLVISGQEHGIGKTSFFRHILPKELSKYFVESKISGKNKDAKFRMCRNLIMLDDEFGGNAFSDQKEFKDISDKNTITDRLSYGRRDVTLKRRVALCGTCNEVDILKDVTGNRRILPINAKSIDYEDMIKINTEDMLIEAYNMLKSGFDWKIYKKEDKEYIDENTKENQMVIPLEEVFFSLFSETYEYEKPLESVFNQGDILTILHNHTPFKPTKFELKDIFVKNKLNYKSHWFSGRNKNGIKLFTNSAIALPNSE